MGRIAPRKKKNHRIYQPLLRTWLLKIWHLSDNFYWMAPLPYFHRRCIFVAAAILLLALLWPSSGHNNLQSSQVTNQFNSTLLPIALTNNNQSFIPKINQSTDNWHSYQVQAGKTLAQLFRENNLSVNDAFAMAHVEGNDKPLSNLQIGQEVRIMLDKQGVVKVLAINAAHHGVVFFTRQDDGSYRRHHDTAKP